MNVDTLTVARLRSLIAAGVLGTAGAFSSLAACEAECEVCPREGGCVVGEEEATDPDAEATPDATPEEEAGPVAETGSEEEVENEPEPPVCPGPGDPGWNCPACGMG